jgi:bifunctional ADP-heptose synthase (sugar kinase/adenylyltransferase)
VVGTTGAGDCTVAGFLMGLLQGESPETAIRCAAAVGALSVQSADATSNIAPWSSVTDWLQKSRPQRKLSFAMQGWRLCPKAHVYVGPADVTSPLGAR